MEGGATEQVAAYHQAGDAGLHRNVAVAVEASLTVPVQRRWRLACPTHGFPASGFLTLNGTSWLSIRSYQPFAVDQAGLEEVGAGASAAAEHPSSVGKASEREKTPTDIVQAFQS